MPGDIRIHVVGINHMLNDHGSTFDPKNDFDMSLIVVLCSIIVRSSACANDYVLTRRIERRNLPRHNPGDRPIQPMLEVLQSSHCAKRRTSSKR